MNSEKTPNKPSIKKNFILSTLYEILTVITPFITAPYAARVLGAANTGIYSFTNANEMYFSLIAVMGTSTYGKREIARTRDDKELNSKLFWEIEILSIFTSLFALFGWGIFVFLVQNYKIFYLILTINIFSKMFDISWFYKGLEQFQYTVTRNSVVKIIGIICLFVFVKSPDDLWIYFLFHVGVNLLGNLSMWITLPRFLVKVNPKDFKYSNHFKETLIYFIPTIATSIYTVLDKTLIGVITKENEQNGYYEQATKVVNIVKTICFTSLNAIMGSRVSYLFEQRKFDEIKDKIAKSSDFILFMTIGCCFGLIGIAHNFVPIFYGQGYEGVISILIVLSPVLIITGISTCLNHLYYTPFGYKRISARYIIIGSIVNLICNLLFIPHFKSVGAVIGTLIAESIIMILYIINCEKYLTFNQLFLLSWKKIISALIMLLIIFLLNNIFNNKILTLIIQIVIGSITYIFILLLLRDKIFKFIFSKMKRKQGKSYEQNTN